MCYQNSLSIYPRHLASLQSLGLLYLKLGSPRLAELALRAAIRLDPHSHVSWFNLGLVMEVTIKAWIGVWLSSQYIYLIYFQTIENESETAANCFATAQNIETSSPIMPFKTIPLAFE